MTFRIEDQKAKDVLINGKPLDPKRTYKVATIDYVAQGGDRQPQFAEASNYQGQGMFLRDAVLNYLKKNPTIKVPATGRIKVPATKAPDRVRD
ncbi:bifunctional UDP-sugar hydrolase/5'-nucleotidase periplasmic precursor [compost metagenome]